MKFSTKTRYGIRAILEIAIYKGESGIYQKEISANQKISYKYLDHIISALKVAGLVVNAHGRKSGYKLAIAPSEITVYQIHNAFESGICVIDCLSKSHSCERENYCASKGFWGELNNLIITYFKATTLQDLIDDKMKLNEMLR